MLAGTGADDSARFIGGLESGPLEGLRAVPKSDLHSHADAATLRQADGDAAAGEKTSRASAGFVPDAIRLTALSA